MRRLSPVAALVAIAVPLAVLGIGAQQGTVLLCVAALCITAGVLGLKNGAAVPKLAWACAALAAFCAVQAAPMPTAWLASLSVNAFEVWSRALHAFREPGPALAALSLDPGASVVEALKWTSYAFLLVACRDVRSRFGSAWLVSLVFASGGVLAVVTLLHGALDLKTVYGFYAPTFSVERWSRGPLPNSNNLAGYANLALFCGLSLWQLPRSPLPRWVLAAGGVALLMATFLSGSRAGILALLLGLVVLGLHASWMRRRSLAAPLGLAALAVTLTVAAVAMVADERLYQTLFSTDAVRKLAVFKHSLAMVRDYPIFGVGRGAFESAFSPYYEPPDGDFATIYAHAENFPLQFVSEWGVAVGGVVLVAGALFFARAAWRRRRDASAVALTLGISVVLLQNLADLGLEIPGLVVALIVAWSALDQRTASSLPRSPARAAAYALPGVAVFTLAFGPAFHGVQEDRARLSRLFASANLKVVTERSKVREALRAATLRHPAEPFFAFVTALVAYRGRDKDPLPALERALERSPYSGQTHLLLAHALHRRGVRHQALLHLRLAARYDRLLRAVAIERAVAWSRDGRELAGALPSEPEVLAAACAKVPLSERRVACWKEYELLAPKQAGKAAEAWLSLLETKSPPCDAERPACVANAEREIAALERSSAAVKERVASLAARLRGLEGDAAGAARDLLADCPATESALACHEQAIALARSARANELVVTAILRWLPLVCASQADACANHKSRAGRWLGEAGAPGLALRYLTEAANLEPSCPRWLDVADAALAANSVPTARVALERARQFEETRASEHARLVALEQRVIQAEGLVKRSSTN
jgi:hypothetical protein